MIYKVEVGSGSVAVTGAGVIATNAIRLPSGEKVGYSA
jgi:hypothetical protein